MADNPAIPVDPATLSPSQAGERLAELSADKQWASKLLSNDGPTRREFEALSERKLAADRIEAVMDGTAQPQPFETTRGGEISTHNIALGVESLRAIGIEDAPIRAFLQGVPVPKQDREAVDRLLTQLKADAGWVDRLMKGGVAERQVLTKLMMGQLRPVSKETA